MLFNANAMKLQLSPSCWSVSHACKLFSPSLHQRIGISCWHSSSTGKPLSRASLVRSLSDDEQWAAELQIFRKRTMQPNQLEALAKAEARANIGRVISVGEGLTVVSGLNSDAPVGATVDFASGAKGVLLWWHNDNVCVVLVLAGEELVATGDGAQCKVSGVLQVVDEEEGAQTKPEYELYMVAVGERLTGEVVNHLGVSGDGHLGPPRLPLLNEQVSMQNREVISEPLMLGIKCMDVLTPMARGSALLMAGTRSAAKSRAVLDAICNLGGTGVRCVYAAVGHSAAEVEARVQTLRAAGALEHTTVVAATDRESLGRQYAAMCTALCVGEHVRNGGGAALVVLDSVESMPRVWSALMRQIASCGVQTPGAADDGEQSEEAFDLVEYEGMLITAAAAQRRAFFSSLMQRAAKMHRRLGGGSLSLLMCLDGVPATGTRSNRAPSLASYKHLSDAQKAKLASALAAQAAAALASADSAVAVAESSSSFAGTELVEELMSISDGQMIVRPLDESCGGIELDFQQSLSRMGSRAYYPALQELAPQVRLDLVQANDAERFAGDQAERQQVLRKRRAAVTRAALQQAPGTRATLEEQVALLWVLQNGSLDDVAPEQISGVWQGLWAHIQTAAFDAVQQIQATTKLTAASKRLIQDACLEYLRSRS